MSSIPFPCTANIEDAQRMAAQVSIQLLDRDLRNLIQSISCLLPSFDSVREIAGEVFDADARQPYACLLDLLHRFCDQDRVSG